MARVSERKLKKRLENLQAREQYYINRNKTGEGFNSTVRAQPRMQVGYQSLFLRKGAAPEKCLLTKVSEQAVAFYGSGGTGEGAVDAGITALGLIKLTSENTDDFVPNNDLKRPSQVQAVKGIANPVGDRTPWGTRYVRYTAKGEGSARVSFTAPISAPGADVTEALLVSRVNAIKNARAAQIGEYGTLRLTLEKYVKYFDAT